MGCIVDVDICEGTTCSDVEVCSNLQLWEPPHLPTCVYVHLVRGAWTCRVDFTGMHDVYALVLMPSHLCKGQCSVLCAKDVGDRHRGFQYFEINSKVLVFRQDQFYSGLSVIRKAAIYRVY